MHCGWIGNKVTPNCQWWTLPILFYFKTYLTHLKNSEKIKKNKKILMKFSQKQLFK